MIETMKTVIGTLGKAVHLEIQEREKAGTIEDIDHLVAAAYHLAQARVALNAVRKGCADARG